MNRLPIPCSPPFVLWLTTFVAVLLAAPAPGATKAPRPHAVEVADVTRESLRTSSTYTGSLRHRRKVRIFNQEEGRVTALPFYEGDQVQREEVVLRLDDALLRAEVDKAGATLGQAVQDLDRLKRLKRDGLVAEEEYSQAVTALEIARAEERMLRIRLGYTRVTAPFAGVVTERLVEPGDIVPRHTHVLTLADPSSLLTELPVSELLITHLSPGDSVNVRIDALGAQVFSGRILRLHPDIDAQTRQGMVEVELRPVPARARAGQFVRVTMSSQTPDLTVVPFSAIRRDRDSEFVYVLEGDGRALRVPVRSGRRLADRVEVIEGLEPGQQVVIRGFLGLLDGMQVHPVDTPADGR